MYLWCLPNKLSYKFQDIPPMCFIAGIFLTPYTWLINCDVIFYCCYASLLAPHAIVHFTPVYRNKAVKGDRHILGESVTVWPFCTHRTQETSLLIHPKHTVGYDSIYSHMPRRPPPIYPIKGWVLPSLVSQSLALEPMASQNLAMTDTLDYTLHHPLLDKLLAMH